MKRIVIVGGVAGGMSAATRLRRLDPEASITVLERSGFVSYANCGLPYYVGGVIADQAALLLQTPESLDARFELDVRIESEVIHIDREAKEVEVLAEGGTYRLGYDVLILSPGAQPVVPPIPGIERAHTLRTVEDVKRIADAVAAQPATAVVIGGGFIGIESAENLVHRKIDTAIVEAANQVMTPLDPELATLVHDEIERNGVQLFLGSGVERIDEKHVHLADGRALPAELVIAAIGVRPDVTLARDCGLEVGSRGGIVVNEFGQTDDLSIYAIGDVAEKKDAFDGEATLVPLANIANRQGRVAADHIMGRSVRPVATIGTAIVKVFDLTVAVTGWNEKRLTAQGIPTQAIHTHPGSHAGYYPGAEQMALKLLVHRQTHQILGAQAVGKDGVDKRIDVIATAMRCNLPAPELADLELAYAPPFGSAKDPVNMLGYIAENLLTGFTENVQWHDIDALKADGYVLVDVRTPAEFAAGALPHAINVPLDELRERFDELPQAPIIVYCQVGQRGHTATVLIREKGHRAVNLDGGFKTWTASQKIHHSELVSK
jgi:NADPH-dependent 2,4-dienoyl-CoA reductase/sulfur reductase-like enzyme/rhodanese-related sulfurtransferase